MSKAYRGVLKARISKLYGGDVTIAKAKALKNRKDATPRDKQLANWFINMQTNRPLKKRKDPVVGTGKKGKQRKDRYSALIMANMAARTLARLPEATMYNFYGGFATMEKSEKQGDMYSGPNWFTDSMKDIY